MPPVPEDECQLLDGFGQLIQILCGCLAFTALVVKRFKEHPRRAWKIWNLDVSKQMLSGLVAHFIGMLTATIMAQHTEHVSPCSWYLIAFSVDTTLGMFCALLLLRCGQYLASVRNWTSLMHTGDYLQVVNSVGRLVRSPSLRVWGIQTSFWVFACVVPARFVCMATIYVCKELLLIIAREIGRWFAGNPHGQLIFVMLLGPLVLNTVQFLVQDARLKKSKRGEHRLLVEEWTPMEDQDPPAQIL